MADQTHQALLNDLPLWLTERALSGVPHPTLSATISELCGAAATRYVRQAAESRAIRENAPD
jgi:hypothetical protein